MKISLDSSRQGHLTIALAAAIALGIIAAYYGHPWLLQSAIAVPLWELLATPDMDIPTRRVRGNIFRRLWVTYWKPFATSIPHRSPFSHSLVLGLPCRMAYVLALPVGVALAGGMSIDELLGWAIALRWVAMGCAVADAIHMAKDGYGLSEMLLGRW